MTPYWTCTHHGAGLPGCPLCDPRVAQYEGESAARAEIRAHLTAAAQEIALQRQYAESFLDGIAEIRHLLADAMPDLPTDLPAHELAEYAAHRLRPPDHEVQVGGDPPPPKLGMRYRTSYRNGSGIVVFMSDAFGSWASLIAIPGYPNVQVIEIRDEHDRVLWRRE